MKRSLFFLCLLAPMLLFGQVGDYHALRSTFSFTNPRVGQFICFDLAWPCEGDWLRYDDKQFLDSLSSVIFLDTNLVWEVGYHTDCRASKEYNKKLSTGRAKDIWEYLIEKGADSSRFTYRGYGESQLLNHCECEPLKPGGYMEGPGMNCTEEEHAENSRAELKLVKILNDSTQE